MKMGIQCDERITTLQIIIFLASLVCFTSVGAGGQEDRWRSYYTSVNQGSKHFYDPQSIVRTPKTVSKTVNRRIMRQRKISKKTWFVKVSEKIVFNEPGFTLNESKVLWEFDCSNKKVHTLMRSDVYKNGTLKIRGKSGAWQGIDSEPQLVTLCNLVCPSSQSTEN